MAAGTAGVTTVDQTGEAIYTASAGKTFRTMWVRNANSAGGVNLEVHVEPGHAAGEYAPVAPLETAWFSASNGITSIFARAASSGGAIAWHSWAVVGGLR